MSEQTLFDKIVDGSIPSWKVWEDEQFLAFLTPFPNAVGFTVVIPKVNPGDNYLDVDDKVYSELLLASKKVAQLLRDAFGVERVGLVIEGQAVPHLHVKLIPMHGDYAELPNVDDTPMEFYPKYLGYLTTTRGPRMSDDELDEVQRKIQEAANA
jgi:histidine triad (HIT) family protein